MPSAAPTFCSVPTCPNIGTYKGRCAQHARVQERTRYNSAIRKWYCSEYWKNLRASVLAQYPICVDCGMAPSTMVDHREPHRGQYAVFWNRANLQAMCADCHGRKTARGE